ncbi:MAG: hypothetical protein U1B30_16395 [Pseudomonadota bacterium]|nr:hypothetical protein [Pseudomonadota bacterium]
MALVSCKECKKEVSKSAKTCPHCGVKDPGITAKDYVLGLGIIFGIIILLSQCSFDETATKNNNPVSQKFNIVAPVDASEEVKSIVDSSVGKIKAACPGLDKYADSLAFEGAKDNFSIASNASAERVDLTFAVAGDGGSIPNEYGAWGQRCFLEVSRNGRELRIPKLPCQSVCLDKSMVTGGSVPLVISLE